MVIRTPLGKPSTAVRRFKKATKELRRKPTQKSSRAGSGRAPDAYSPSGQAKVPASRQPEGMKEPKSVATKKYAAQASGTPPSMPALRQWRSYDARTNLISGPGMGVDTALVGGVSIAVWHPTQAQVEQSTAVEMARLKAEGAEPADFLQARINVFAAAAARAQKNAHGAANVPVVMVAPEWIFRGEHGALSHTNMLRTVRALMELSDATPDLLIVGGSILWAEPNPELGSKSSKSGKDKGQSDTLFNSAPVVARGKLVHVTHKRTEGLDRDVAQTTGDGVERGQVFVGDTATNNPFIREYPDAQAFALAAWPRLFASAPHASALNHVFRFEGKTYALEICADHSRQRATKELAQAKVLQGALDGLSQEATAKADVARDQLGVGAQNLRQQARNALAEAESLEGQVSDMEQERHTLDESRKGAQADGDGTDLSGRYAALGRDSRALRATAAEHRVRAASFEQQAELVDTCAALFSAATDHVDYAHALLGALEKALPELGGGLIRHMAAEHAAQVFGLDPLPANSTRELLKQLEEAQGTDVHVVVSSGSTLSPTLSVARDDGVGVLCDAHGAARAARLDRSQGKAKLTEIVRWGVES